MDLSEAEGRPYERDFLGELTDATYYEGAIASEDAATAEKLAGAAEQLAEAAHRGWKLSELSADDAPLPPGLRGVRGVLEGLSVAIGSNTFSRSMTFPSALATEYRRGTDAIRVDTLRRGAVEYNVGRSSFTSLPVPFSDAEPVLAITSRPLSPNALRVCAILMGAWVATTTKGCAPDVGRHVAGCRHATNRVDYTLRSLTRAVMGQDGGRQRELVGAALLELGHDTTEFYLWDAATGRYGHQVSHILSFRQISTLPAYALPRDMPPDAQGYLAWDPFLHESLMRGHYAAIPAELVRELSGVDFAVWLAVLLQPATRELIKAGEWREYSVSGTDPLLDRARLGLGGSRPDKLRASLERAAERGNAIAEGRLGLRLSVAERTRRGRSLGYKLVLERVRDRASLRLSEGVYTGTGDTYSGTGSVYSGTGSVYSRTRNVRKTASLDALSSLAIETGSIGGAHGAQEPLSVKKGRTKEYPTPSWDEGGSVMEAWRTRYPERPTPSQLRYLGNLVAGNDAPGIARGLREAPPGDALAFVKVRIKAEKEARKAEEDEGGLIKAERARVMAGRKDTEAATVLEAVQERTVRAAPPVQERGAAGPNCTGLRPWRSLATKPEDEAAKAARQRAFAIAQLRNGLEGELGATLRAKYGLSDADIWPERP